MKQILIKSASVTSEGKKNEYQLQSVLLSIVATSFQFNPTNHVQLQLDCSQSPFKYIDFD